MNIIQCKHVSAKHCSSERACRCISKSRVMSLKCAGPLQLVVTILHYNIMRKRNPAGINGPVFL